MMNEHKTQFGAFVRDQIQTYKTSHGLTNEDIAAILQEDVRSYASQRSGKYGFSALSLAHFILELQGEERDVFMEKMLEEVGKIRDGE